MGNRSSASSSEVPVLSARGLYNIQADLTSFLLLIHTGPGEQRIDQAVVATRPQDAVALAEERPYTTVVAYGTQAHHICHALSKSLDSATRLYVLDDLQEYQELYPFNMTGHPHYFLGRIFPSVVHHSEHSASGDVFISNFGVASNVGVLRLLKITHIVNCTVDCPFPVTSQAELKRLELELEERLKQARNDDDEVTVEYLEACFNEQSIAQRLSTVEMQTFRVPVVDEADQLISRHFEEAIKFTDQALKVGGRVLFHCKHGQSRSATVLAAWLIARCGHTVESALEHLKHCRPRVGPNQGFVQQLEEFECSITKSPAKS